MRKYNPTHIKSRDWNEIRSWYSELIDEGLNLKPMLDLINHILEKELNKRLFASTSMHKLLISIYEEMESDREILKIEFDQINEKWSFDYYAKPFQDAEFSRRYNMEMGIEKFNQFIDFIKW